jgi:hypothetical protein
MFHEAANGDSVARIDAAQHWLIMQRLVGWQE